MKNSELLTAPLEVLSQIDRQKRFLLQIAMLPAACVCGRLVSQVEASKMALDDFPVADTVGVNFTCPGCHTSLEVAVPFMGAAYVWMVRKRLPVHLAQVKETGRTQCQVPNHANVSKADEAADLDLIESAIQELVKAPFEPVINNCINVLIGAYRASRAIINTHNLCHDLHGKVGVKEFASGCVQEQRKLFGCAPHMERVAELETAMRTLRGYLGSNRNIPTGVMDVINKQLELAITPEERQPPAPAAQQ